MNHRSIAFFSLITSRSSSFGFPLGVKVKGFEVLDLGLWGLGFGIRDIRVYIGF